MPLLLTCRQVRSELQAVMELERDIEFHVDVAVVQDKDAYSDMWCMWLALPMPPRYCRLLRISLRLKPSEHDHLLLESGWRGKFRSRFLNEFILVLVDIYLFGPSLCKMKRSTSGQKIPRAAVLLVELVNEEGVHGLGANERELYHTKVEEICGMIENRVKVWADEFVIQENCMAALGACEAPDVSVSGNQSL